MVKLCRVTLLTALFFAVTSFGIIPVASGMSRNIKLAICLMNCDEKDDVCIPECYRKHAN